MKKVMIVLCLVSFVMCGNAFADTIFTNNDGAGDNLWRTSSNWTNGYPDEACDGTDNSDGVHYEWALCNTSTTVILDPNDSSACFPGGPAYRTGDLFWGHGATAGMEMHVIMTGGQLDAAYNIYFGATAGDFLSTFTLSDGIVNTGHFLMSGASENRSVANMTGGEINLVGYLFLPYVSSANSAAFYLHGGTINAAGLSMTAVGYLEVGDGVLVLAGDQTGLIGGYIGSGLIQLDPSLPAGAILDVDYDGTNTTLRAFVPGPKQAKNPSPENGAYYVDKEISLTWTAGDEAVSHDVYFGEYDEELALVSDDQGGTSYGPMNLEWGRAYSWRIDEYDGVGNITGPDWSFTVTDHVLAENFEYSDPNAFVANWSAAKSDLDPDNGLPVYLKPGTQALMLAYDNSQTPYYKEVTRSWATDQDWTYEGVEVLSLWFEFAVEADFDGLYVEISDGTNTAVLTNADSYADIDTAYDGWQEINLDLSQFTTVDMTKVRSLTIGMGSPTPVAGNANLVYVDEIRLYPKRCFEGAPVGDVTGDCKVNLLDVVEIAGSWLTDGLWPN